MSSERKINLVYNKFVSGNPSTNISNNKFYSKLKSQTSKSDLCVYLTNGTNKRLDSVGEGTTEAFKILSATGNLFDLTDAVIVFDPKSKSFDKKTEIESTISDSNQVWTCPSYNGMYAGSVIRVNVTGSKPEFPVCGGYHINGIELNKFADNKEKVETDSVGLVKAYYTAIMDDFFTLAMAAPSSSGPSSGKHHVLHLAQIPGTFYGGTEITGNAFHAVVTDWIKNKTNDSLSVSMTISIDFADPGVKTTAVTASAIASAADAATAAAAATTSSVTKEQITELQTGLDTARPKVLVDTADKIGAFTIAEEIFNAFFGGGDVKTNQTKYFLTAQIDKLNKTTIFYSDPAKKKLLALITSRLDSIIVPATTTTAATPAKPLVSSKTKYVFAFDIDDTLVRSGTLDKPVEGSIRHASFKLTDATDYDAMITLMKDIINAGHHVWIVTANTNISKEDFEEKYLKGDTGITKNYYFMNPATVDKDLNAQFDSGQISPYLTADTDTTKTLNLTFKTDDSGSEFQTKGLKPYAMIAKWLELGNTNMDEVQMYLFDDTDRYEPICTNVKGGKIEFVKITPAVGDSTSQFKSDVLIQATKKFNALKTTEATTKAPVTSGGGMNVMTFNTWHEALGTTPRQIFCMSDSKNICQDNIRAAILAQMDKPGPVVIFLQEFTYNFEEFFGSDIILTADTSGFQSACKVLNPKGTLAPDKRSAFRHFRIERTTPSKRQFKVYTGQIGNSVMTTIYSVDLTNASATYYVMGNLASGMNPGDNLSKYEIVPTFSGPVGSITEDVKGIQVGYTKKYDFIGGDRPFMVLRFDDPALQLILLNIHAPKNDNFDPRTSRTPLTTVAGFAFDAIGPFFNKNIFTSIGVKTKTDYRIVAGGDFNTDADNALDGLKAVLTDVNSSFKRDGKTCCTTGKTDGLTFKTTVDHIFSTLPITDYNVHNITTTPKTAEPRYYFSDHLPVYATVTLPVATGVSASP